jgi:large subunit ribosomal protein L17
MIHRRKGRKLKRTASHRKATLSNLSVSLIKHKKIQTTLAKAKELRRFVESLITKSKKAYLTKDTKAAYGVHLRREANKFLQDKGAVTMLFEEIAPKVIDRPGGYTRVLKMGRRLGDAAEIALIELVDYNLEQTENKGKEKTAESEKKTEAKKTLKKNTKKPKKSTKEASSKPKKKKKAKEEAK